MRSANLVQQSEEVVHVLECLDALVERVHHDRGVLGQLETLGLRVPTAQLPKLLEEVDELRVILEQPAAASRRRELALTPDT